MDAIVSLLTLLLVFRACGSIGTHPASGGAVTPARMMAPADYWHAVLPDTPMPQAIHDLLTQSTGEDNVRDVSTYYGSQGLDNLREVSTSYGSQGVENLREVSTSYGSQGEDSLREASTSYKSQGQEAQRKVTTSHGSHGEDLKEVSTSYGFQGEDSRKATMTYRSQSKKGLREVSTSYGSQGHEDSRKVAMAYESQGKEDLREVSISYGSQGEEDLREVSTSYRSQDKKGLREVSTSYGSQGEESLREVSTSYRSQDKKGLREVSTSYGSQGEEGLRKASTLYRSHDKKGFREVSTSYGSQDEEDSREATISYQSKAQEESRTMATMVHGSHCEDLRKTPVSYGSRSNDHASKITMSNQQRKGDMHGQHDHSHHSHNNGNQLADVFFFHDVLRPGSMITPTIPQTTSLPPLLPRHQAQSLPFSTERFADIVAMLAPASLGMADEMRRTLDTCEHPRPLPGEKAGCATSLESLAKLPAALLGTRNVRAFSGDMPIDAAGTPAPARRGRYNVTAVVKLSESPTAATCHDLTYPYAVFYCHTTNPAATYMVTLVAQDGREPDMEALAVCHLDTSLWSPTQPFLVAHNLKPGDVAVCHFLSKLSIIWVPAGEQQGGAWDAQ